jgi:hypothetical protein
MRSVTFHGSVGQTTFSAEFAVNSQSDLSVTVGGVTSTFTYANGVVTVPALVAAADVVITSSLDLNAVANTGGVTDAQLRATPLPVSLTGSSAGLTDTQLRASPVPVTGPQTDAQARATPLPVSLASTPLPTGAAQDGVDGTSITAPAGGSGIRGWLSGIYKSLTGILTVSKAQQTVTDCTFTFATSTTVSAAVDLGVTRLVGLTVPASFEGTVLTPQSNDDGAGYKNIYDKTGTQLTITVGASRRVILSPADYLGIRTLQFVSGTPVTANRSLKLISEQ